jgi:transposase
VLLSAQGMDVVGIAKVTFTSDDRVRNVIHNFNSDGFASLYPKYKGGRAPKFTMPERREIKKIAKSKPAEDDLPFSTWSLSKLAEFLVAEGMVDDISHEGLRVLLREEGVSFQRVKTWKTSRDPDHQVKKARIEHLYAVADGEVIAEAGEPTVIFCLDLCRRRLREALRRGYQQYPPGWIRHHHAQDPRHRHRRPAAPPRPLTSPAGENWRPPAWRSPGRPTGFPDGR